MFQVGDKVVYTAERADCLTGYVKRETKGVVVTKSNGAHPGNYCYVEFDGVEPRKWAVYNGDIAMDGPEPYEAWFKE